MNGLPEYLRGAVDLHVHSSPDVVPRRFDDIELAREAGDILAPARMPTIGTARDQAG